MENININAIKCGQLHICPLVSEYKNYKADFRYKRAYENVLKLNKELKAEFIRMENAWRKEVEKVRREK